MSIWFLLLSLLAASVVVLAIAVRRQFSQSQELFTGESTKRNQVVSEAAKKEEAALLKQSLTAALRKIKAIPSSVGSALPEEITVDAIVIGSGIGGLTSATLLAKHAGLKPLLLEQHDVLGGCMHTYEEKGFLFDTGVHYIGGEVDQGGVDNGGAPRSETKILYDEVCGGDGALNWTPMHTASKLHAFDVVVSKAENLTVPWVGNAAEMKTKLAAVFPKEKQAIEAYYKEMHAAANSIGVMFAMKILPLWLYKLLSPLLHLLGPVRKAYYYLNTTTSELMTGLGCSKELIGLITYLHGDYGLSPSNSPFALQAIVAKHYKHGSSYPTGGSERITVSCVKTLEKHGGAAAVRTKVDQILVGSDGQVQGVVLANSKQILRTKLIISSTGAYSTFTKMLSQEDQVKYVPNEVLHALSDDPHAVASAPPSTGVYSALRDSSSPALHVGPSTAMFSLFVGLDGDPQELELPPHNFWVFPSLDQAANASQPHWDRLYKVLFEASAEDEKNFKPAELTKEFSVAFLSFPGAKDFSTASRTPGKSTAVICAPCPNQWFDQWREGKVKNRGREYEKIKENICAILLEFLFERLPHLRNKVSFYQLGTPLSNNYYLGCYRGETYGLEHTVARFRKENFALTSPYSNIGGLFMSGQDTSTCGVSGALIGGFLAAVAARKKVIWGLLPMVGEIVRNKVRAKQDKSRVRQQPSKKSD